MSTQFAQKQAQKRAHDRNRETGYIASGCLFTIGIVGGLNLLDDSSRYDDWLIGTVIAGLMMAAFWYVACSLLFGITLHWQGKERAFRSQSKSSDN